MQAKALDAERLRALVRGEQLFVCDAELGFNWVAYDGVAGKSGCC